MLNPAVELYVPPDVPVRVTLPVHRLPLPQRHQQRSVMQVRHFVQAVEQALLRKQALRVVLIVQLQD